MSFLWRTNDINPNHKGKKNDPQGRRSSFDNLARRQEAKDCGNEIADIFEGGDQRADEGVDKRAAEGGILARIGIATLSPLKYDDNVGEKKRTKQQGNKRRHQNGGGSSRRVPPLTAPLSQANSSLKKAKQLQHSNRHNSKATASIYQPWKNRETKPKATNDIMANLSRSSTTSVVERKNREQQQQEQQHRKRQNQYRSPVGGGCANDAVDLTSNDNDDDTGIARSNRRGSHPSQAKYETVSHDGCQETAHPKNPYNKNRSSSGRPSKHQSHKHEEEVQPFNGSSLPEDQNPPKSNLNLDSVSRNLGRAQRQKHKISKEYASPDGEHLNHCLNGLSGAANDKKLNRPPENQERLTQPGEHMGFAPRRRESLQSCGRSNSDCTTNRNPKQSKQNRQNRNGQAAEKKPLINPNRFANNRQVLVQDNMTGTQYEIVEDMENGGWRRIEGSKINHQEGQQPKKEQKKQKQESKSQSPGEVGQDNHQQPGQQQKKRLEQRQQRISQPTSENGRVDHREHREQPPKKKRRSSGHLVLSSDESYANAGSDPTVGDPIEEDEDSVGESNRKPALDFPMRIPRKNHQKGEYGSANSTLRRSSRSTTTSNTSQKKVSAPQQKGNAAQNKNRLCLTKQNGGKTSRKKKGNTIIPGNSLKQQTEETSPTTRTTRSARAKSEEAKAKAEAKAKQKAEGGSMGTAIDLLESDDDESDEDKAGSENQIDAASGGRDEAFDTPRQGATRQCTKSFQEKVPRFALGQKIYAVETKVVLENGVLLLLSESTNAKANNNRCKAALSLKDGANDLMLLRYYQKPEQQQSCLSFLAMKVKITQNNRLKTNHSWYDPESDDSAKAFVVIEFKEGSQLANLLEKLRELEGAQINDEACLLEDAASIEAHRKSLADADQEEAKEAAKSAKRTSRRKRKLCPKLTDAFVAKRPEDTVLLVYPFAGDPTEMENATVGFAEAGGVDATPINETHHGDEMEAPSDQLICDGINDLTIAQSSTSDEIQKAAATIGETAKMEQRRHFLTIQVRDFERLCPGEFLNDSLIDFWMQWITRKLDPKDKNAGFHCFSSHFYTTLVDEGVSAVTKWTAKRGINIFEKKFVFIPINLTLHWSLCVVVNPGDIFKEEDEDPMACLLFLDSLKAHKKSKISKTVRKWLNSEWKRIHNDESPTPFSSDSGFPLLTPKVPYQNNSWDCGVFVCRYAYALFCLRYESFNRGEDWFKEDLVANCIREGLFDFNMADIERLRHNLRELIEKLSRIYVPWKEEQEHNLRLERKGKIQKVNQTKEEGPSEALHASPEKNGDTAGAEQNESQGDGISSQLAQQSSCVGSQATTAVEINAMEIELEAKSVEEQGEGAEVSAEPQEESSSVSSPDWAPSQQQNDEVQLELKAASGERGPVPTPDIIDDEVGQDTEEQDSSTGSQSGNPCASTSSTSLSDADESSTGKENQQGLALKSVSGSPNCFMKQSHPGESRVDHV